MATVLERPAKSQSSPNLRAFLAELTQLCDRHGIGLSDGATLYLMESEDYSRSFEVNEDSELSFV